MEITDFNPGSSISNADNFLIYSESLLPLKMPAVLVKAYLITGISPSIGDDGYWYIGKTKTEIKAEGKTPIFRRGDTGIEVSTDSGVTWTIVAFYTDLSIKFSQMSEVEKQALREALFSEVVEATANANAAASSANTATTEVTSTIDSMNSLITEANSVIGATNSAKDDTIIATTNANTATASAQLTVDSANNAINEITVLKDQLNTSIDESATAVINAQTSVVQCNTATENANLATTNAEVAITNANIATDNANDTATHPTYIGTDNYVYIWNKESSTYNKTTIYCKGDPFTIKKVYTSINEMNEDTSTIYSEGDLVLINTSNTEDVDNAKIYIYQSGEFVLLVDMSGAQGFTGKTPQISVGTVTALESTETPVITLTDNGTDTNGNPLYLLNFSIPRGETSWTSMTEDEKTTILENIQTNLLGFYNGTDSFIVIDSNGNVVIKYNSNGFDTALLSTHFETLIKNISGLGLELGYTSSTAYPGSDGLQLNKDVLKIKETSQYLNLTEESQLSIVDENGNSVVQYNSDGFDTLNLSVHLQNLIKDIEGLGLELGETSTTAYSGDKGKLNADNIELNSSNIISINSKILVIQNYISVLKQLISQTNETEFNITDLDGNSVLKYNTSGLDTYLLSEHLQQLIKNIDGIGSITYDVIETL